MRSKTSILELVMPTIHLNGTGRQALVEQYANAVEALQTALDKVRAAAPHGRDYYPQDGEHPEGTMLRSAQRQHQRWVNNVEVVIADMQALAEGIAGP
jgi:hypothetical protein